jgi:UTP--glucose-1-phosphate uridylyltransferase
MTDDGLNSALQKMRADGVGDAAVQSFAHYYERLSRGDRGILGEDEIEPVDQVTALEDLPDAIDKTALDQAVVIKLNGGLGTSMGMTKAKSLLPVKDGLSFLDIIARQVLELRRQTGARLPLVLMNSFLTQADSLKALEAYDLATDVPADFVQNKVPKLRADGLEPVDWPDSPDLEWAPPGHGDLYVALVTSGMLDTLLESGYRYAFVSNADNLGAVLDPRILSWIASEDIPFVMEVAQRTAADRKGGHIARRPGGGLVLREIAQTPDDDLESFQDIDRHQYFNTNTLWVDLHALRAALAASDGVLSLPMIVNRKNVDPTNPDSPEVIQLETAMGAAIDVFAGARALLVPKERFAPVKTTNELLALRSDAYELRDNGQVVLAEQRHHQPPVVDLDPSFYKLVDDFEARFPDGAPSLIGCDRLVVRGDHVFSADTVFTGSTTVQP